MSDTTSPASPTPLSDRQKIRKLPFYIAAMTMNSVFTTLTVFGSVFPLFLADLGLDKAQIGLALALIPYATLISPLMAPFVSKWGFRRTFLIVWTTRKFIITAMLFAPVILANAGLSAAFSWVIVCIIGFALCRATGETGLLPWTQELVPNDIRGKFMALENLVVTIGQIIVVALAGFLIDHLVGSARYVIPMGIGVVGGLVGVSLFSFLPGGKPVRQSIDLRAHLTELRMAFADRNFMSFMGMLTLVTLGSGLSSSFIPLFANEEIGLSPGSVVLLSIGASIGTLVTSVPVGWALDRIGNKPLMWIGLGMLCALPICWLAVPRQEPTSVIFAMVVSGVSGVASITWSMSWSRFLFNAAVPPRYSAVYLSVYYAWSSFVGGSGPLLAGGILTALATTTFNPYAALFMISLAPMVGGGMMLTHLRDHDSVSLRQLAGQTLGRIRDATRTR
ncbi:MAG: MFS transporter [Anaerolineae bacterium]|nr:MFS transporter [Thermoflexales bacterium]MDW8408990.1 MFS transporter [Anaerolineae bacterium]